MRSARYTSSPSPRAGTSTDASPIPSAAVSEMNISTTTDDHGDDELSTTPTGPSLPSQSLHFAPAPRSVSSQEDGKGKRPRLAHRLSVGSGLFGVNVPSGPSSASPYTRRRPSFAPASLPSHGWAGDNIFNTRGESSGAPTVSPQHDYLANWESLHDLVMPTPEGSSRYRSPTSRRRDPSPGVTSQRAQSAYGALGATPGRGTFGRSGGRDINRVPSVTETDEEDDEAGVSSYSAVLSSSPPILDGFGATPSFGTAGEQIGSPETERPSVCTPAARPVTPSPGQATPNPPGATTPLTPAAGGAPKKTGMLHSDTRR